MKHIWKVVTSVGVVIGMIVSFYTIDGVYARAADVQQSMSVMGQGVQLQIDTSQLTDFTAQRYRVLRILEDNPDDTNAKEELEFLNSQIKFLRERIQTTTINLGKGATE